MKRVVLSSFKFECTKMNLVSIEQKKISCVFLLKCKYCPLSNVMNANKHMHDGDTTWMQLTIWIDLNNMDEDIHGWTLSSSMWFPNDKSHNFSLITSSIIWISSM